MAVLSISRSATAPVLAVLLVLAAAEPANAADVQVSVRVSAIDIGFPTVINTDGGQAGALQGTPPLASFSVQGTSGIVLSSAAMQADAFTGKIRGNLLSSVGDTAPRVGRGGSATGTASMVGSITLAGPAPGVATFTGVVEGAYNFGTADARYFNSGSIEANGIIGDVYREIGTLNFDPRTGAGLFSVPLTWTMAVLPGQRLDMSFYLRSTLTTVVDISSIDIANTFKLTAIDLPAGYTYKADEQGFLSQFAPTAVPEPASSTLLLAGLGGVAVLARRRGLGVRRRPPA